MKLTLRVSIVLIMLGNLGCQAQTSKKMETTNNPLICDPVEGKCGIPNSTSETTIAAQSKEKPVKVIYFTDPICSSCWGIEPQLRKLKLEYGNNLEIEYRMGGLLPNWSYNGGGISRPSDVAHHWDEASEYYDMPIDGDVWFDDPLHSSYPASIAFKAAEIQDKEKAVLFLREIREMVFLRKKNIAKWEHLETAATNVGLDAVQFKKDYESSAKSLFEEDLKLARSYGVRGFPTIFLVNNSGNREIVYGSRPYSIYETSVLKLHPTAIKSEYDKNWEMLFSTYHSLTAKEFSELSGTPRSESEHQLDLLAAKGKLIKLTTRNGSIWMRMNTGR